MELEEVMRTTFAARDFTAEPIPDDILYRILDNARFAPSGGNRQGWRVLVIKDRTTRRRLADLCVEPLRLYLAQVQAGENPWNTVIPSKVSEETVEKTEVRWPMLERIEELPVLLVVCVDLSVVAAFDRDLDRVGVVAGASIYPFVWNILLAARDLGYGGTITTFLVGSEPQAKELLGIPDSYAIAAMLPLGRPVKQLTKLRRKPVEEITMVDRWGGEPLKP